MKEVTYYVADDGTKFDDETECEEYELEKKREKFNNSILFLNFDKLNDKMNRLPLDYNGFQDATFLYIANDEALKYFHEQSDYYGYASDGIVDTGWYYYSYENDGWENLQALIRMIDCIKPYIAKTSVAKNTDSISW